MVTKAPSVSLVRDSLCRLGRVQKIEQLGTAGPLEAAGPGGPYANALFGRDSALMALDLVTDFPAVAEATILALTACQGTRTRRRSEEEPGRILHEDRAPGAYVNPHWDYPYYGSIDATPLYVKLVHTHVQCHGADILDATVRDRTGRTVTIREGVQRATQWIRRRVQRFGLLYVLRSQPHGLPNQVWPDSYDAFLFEDGLLFDPRVPYAPAGVQGHAFDALYMGADLMADRTQAALCRELADGLRRTTLRELWLASEGTFGLALAYGSPKPRVSRVVASDAGHLLDSGLLEGAANARKRAALRTRLMAPDMLASAGLRTRSVGSPRFNPGSYHNGSVWPMDTGRIADGLRRHGFVAEAEDLEDRILHACGSVGALVEFFRGEVSGDIRINCDTLDVDVMGERHRVEQEPQALQGWTATRVWRIMRQRGLL